MAEQLAAILVRGREIGIRHEVLEALDTLRLWRKHACVILEDNKQNRGTLQKVKDLVAWGPVSADAVKELSEKRKPIMKDGKPLQVFRLHPPRGGYRKGTKTPVGEGGDIGLHKDISPLLRRML